MDKMPSDESFKNEQKDKSNLFQLNMKKIRKKIDLEMKMKIIELYKGGKSIVKIRKDLNLSQSTVSTIVKDSQRIMEAVRCSASLKTTVITKRRTPAIEEMERILVAWMEEQMNKGITISQGTIQAKARILFESLKENSGNPNEPSKFMASHGWFERFKRRHNLLNLEVPASSVNMPELKKLTCSNGGDGSMNESLQLFQNASEDDLNNHTYVSDLLNIQSQDILNNLLQSKQENMADKNERKEFSTSGLAMAFSTLGKAMNILSSMDPNQRRCENISRLVDESVWCYKEIYNDLKKLESKNLSTFSSQIPDINTNENQNL